MRSTSLYRHFDATGKLLYVGVSLSAIIRLAQHKKADWFRKIASVTVRNFSDRREALAAERAAISAEHPQFNHKRAARMPASRRIVTRVFSLAPQHIRFISKQAFDSGMSASHWLRRLVQKEMESSEETKRAA